MLSCLLLSWWLLDIIINFYKHLWKRLETHSKVWGWFCVHLLHICIIQTFAQQFNYEHFLKPHCHELVLKEDLNRPHPMPSVPGSEEAFMRRRKNAKPATSPSPVPVNVDETEERQGIHWQDAVIQESSIRVFLRCFLLRYSNPVFWPLLNRNTTVFVFFLGWQEILQPTISPKADPLGHGQAKTFGTASARARFEGEGCQLGKEMKHKGSNFVGGATCFLYIDCTN